VPGFIKEQLLSNHLIFNCFDRYSNESRFL